MCTLPIYRTTPECTFSCLYRLKHIVEWNSLWKKFIHNLHFRVSRLNGLTMLSIYNKIKINVDDIVDKTVDNQGN